MTVLLLSMAFSLDLSRDWRCHKALVFVFCFLPFVVLILGLTEFFCYSKQVRYHQQYHREMKGMASPVGAEGGMTKDSVDRCGQVHDTSQSWSSPRPALCSLQLWQCWTCDQSLDLVQAIYRAQLICLGEEPKSLKKKKLTYANVVVWPIRGRFHLFACICGMV
jgi:hypothetical protein